MPIGQTYRVRGSARVGRNSESDIFLVDPSVSRNHALLEVQDGRLIVSDAGSSNGTFVNGVRVQQCRLNAGDTVAFGKTEMVVE
jgi:pSer/pThr/pTyr-binding forkhead associated (FHA) protein